MEQCRQLSNSLPKNVSYEFLGHVDPRQVLPYYISRRIDLFVNVSSTEGVPFSVMEALSAGIPVFATAVGGTGEIVDDTVGRILPEDITPEALSAAFLEFYKLNAATKKQLGESAHRRYVRCCDARVLAESMAHLLIDGDGACDFRAEAVSAAGTA
jgi:glycosyltransferase involved in cell wall biosynthesis